MIYHHRANVKGITVFLNEYKVEKKHDPRTKLAPGAPVQRSALILSSDPSVYKFSGHVLKDFLMKSPIISFMTLTMTLRGSGFKFLPGVSWLIPSSPSYLLYFSVANALYGLFQLTSGAWMYFEHSPEIILGSVLKKTIGGNFYHLPLQQDTQKCKRFCEMFLPAVSTVISDTILDHTEQLYQMPGTVISNLDVKHAKRLMLNYQPAYLNLFVRQKFFFAVTNHYVS